MASHSSDQAFASIAKDPEAAATVEKNTVVGQDKQSFRTKGQQNLDVLDLDGDGETRNCMRAIGIRQGVVHVKGPLKPLNSTSAGLGAGRVEGSSVNNTLKG